MLCGFRGSGFRGSDFVFSPWMSIMMGVRILLFIILVVVAVKLIKSYMVNSSSAMRILDEKFASGEISDEEYTRRRTIIMKKR
ncbi:SHOCT domain-containing protein [Clostridium sp. P21]|uniref:SHOCT domain-containing protein n=1 Tax=Clostridium muellerianum TaxID=2716538 RepID=A0A7Y0EE91_9CLOT|nr:SHOCT domain-containing protein [Clostridium muellerianum]NMM61763.1 SHOCT domain-containing protein [Clostridium muellerianum]